MEVHVPEHPIHTWREFLIHMGTITLGLLIAIALEQTVEWAHHRHQRHELEEQMLVECEQNARLSQRTLEDAEIFYHYDSEVRAALLKASPVNGQIVYTLPPLPRQPSEYFVSPSRGTWNAAAAAGLVARLTTEEAKMYDRLNFNAAEEERAEDAIVVPGARMASDIVKGMVHASAPNQIVLTPELRDDLVGATTEDLVYLSDLCLRLAIYKGGVVAVTQGARTLEALYPYQEKEVKLLRTRIGPE